LRCPGGEADVRFSTLHRTAPHRTAPHRGAEQSSVVYRRVNGKSSQKQSVKLIQEKMKTSVRIFYKKSGKI
jgi:hypothetical protein